MGNKETQPAEADTIQDAKDATDRILLDLVRESREAREQAAAKPEPNFAAMMPPAAVQEVTEATAEYSEEWDARASKASSSNKTDADIRKEMAREGIKPPPTADEVEAAEEAENARIRIERAAANADKPEQPKRQAPNGRTNGAMRSSLRALSGYDKQPDPSNPR